ncbi:FAD-dependent oxidoreductase [Paenibacillus beijingensis]|uniref:NADH oxidase n=1 Tax=Paenibacillus beijingensis TaxID=1126833 RepID=A0A0D5NLK0_9BACL|nr:FAD-dependent oxidoreductase [Paenibacillus beijingensis]AJY75803.1 NADH oxidase [Paenibacillus beijingensis]
MKIAVIGCTHAGTAAVTNMARLYPEADITVYEKNDNISFLSCGIALHVGGVVEHAEQLFYSNPDQLAQLGIQTHMRHEVLAVDTAAKTMEIRNLATGERFRDAYDKLVITTGSWPIIPQMEGIGLENIQLCKNYNHAQAIIEKAKHAETVTVVGAGYIGIELAEAFQMLGKKVILIDNTDRILFKYLDRAFTDPIEKLLADKEIRLALGQSVQAFKGEGGKVQCVVTTAGEYETDMVVLCIGFRPNTELLKGQIDMLPNGAILVDEYMRTSNPDVLAAGDSCAIRYNPTEQPLYIPLATNAVRMGTLAAHNLVQPAIPYRGTQGTSGIKIYDLNIASTGLTEQGALAAGMNVKTITIIDHDKPEFMPHYENVMLKLVYEEEGGRIVGAQVLSRADMTQSINTLSVCIQNRMTTRQLAFVDFFFQPHYNKPWNLLNQAGLQAMEQERKERDGKVLAQ